MDVTPWLQIYHAPKIGPVLFQKILEHYGSPEAFLDNRGWHSEHVNIPEPAKYYFDDQQFDVVTEDLRWQEQPNNHILTLADKRYPALLREIHDPPAILYLKGQPSVLQQVQLAVVGSRNPTPAGQDTTRALTYELARQGMVITSGLALGVDGIAHQATLDAGGTTIAVMGTGLNRVYPAKHHALAHAIEDTGGRYAVGVSALYPTKTEPIPP